LKQEKAVQEQRNLPFTNEQRVDEYLEKSSRGAEFIEQTNRSVEVAAGADREGVAVVPRRVQQFTRGVDLDEELLGEKVEEASMEGSKLGAEAEKVERPSCAVRRV